MTQQPTGTPMNNLPARGLSRKLPALLVAALLTPPPTLAADDPDAPKGPAVTVLKAAKSCFSDVVEVSGIVLAREETMVRPERLGVKVAEVLAGADDGSGKTPGRPDGADQNRRPAQRGDGPGAAGGADGAARQPARPGLYRGGGEPAGPDQLLPGRGDHDRPELQQRRGAADVGALWLGRHRGPAGEASADRDQAGRGRIDGQRP